MAAVWSKCTAVYVRTSQAIRQTYLLSVIFFPAHWSQKSDEYRPSVGRRKSDAGADRFLQRNRSRKSR